MKYNKIETGIASIIFVCVVTLFVKYYEPEVSQDVVNSFKYGTPRLSDVAEVTTK